MDTVYGLYNGAGNLVGLKFGLKWDINLNTNFSQFCAKIRRDVLVCLPNSVLTLNRLPVVIGQRYSNCN